MAAFTITSVFIFLYLTLGLLVGSVTSQVTKGTTTGLWEKFSTAIVTTIIVNDDVTTQRTSKLPDEVTFTSKLPDEVTFKPTETQDVTRLPGVTVLPTRTQRTTELQDRATTRQTKEIADGTKTSASNTKIPNEAISLVRAKSSALIISWIQDPDANEYYIQYYPKHDQQHLQIKHVPATINEAKLSKLDSNTLYVIQIEAKTSLSYKNVGTAEMETLKARCSSSVETALIYIVCLFAAIIILLLIILCCVGRLKRRPNEKVEEARNGDVKLRNKGLEHHNPGYQPTEDEDDEKRTSHAYIYITPENTPVSSPMFILPETKPENNYVQ